MIIIDITDSAGITIDIIHITDSIGIIIGIIHTMGVAAGITNRHIKRVIIMGNLDTIAICIIITYTVNRTNVAL